MNKLRILASLSSLAVLSPASAICATDTAASTGVYTQPKIIKKPSAAEMHAAYPPRALANNLDGRATLSCTATVDGILKNCQTTDVSPQFMGFEESVLSLAPLVRLLPATRNGKPVEAHVTIPINFAIDRNAPPTPIAYIPPKVTQKPSLEDQLAAYPADARKANITGTGTLSCTSTSSGLLTDCKAIDVSPENMGFDRGILALAPLFTVSPARLYGKPVDAPFAVAIVFKIAGATQPAQTTYTPPTLIKKPNVDNLIASYPRGAMAANREGQAILSCTVTITGLFKNCTAIDVSPVGFGFDRAALALAPLFLLTPATENGQPIEVGFRQLIKFKIQGATNYGQTSSVKLFNGTVFWVKTPSQADVIGAFPSSAGEIASGEVAMQCRLTPKGFLEDCSVISALPDGKGFDRAAMKLTGKFQAAPDFMKLGGAGAVVDLRIRLLSPKNSDWQNRYLDKPVWKQTIDIGKIQSIYPPKAAAAGVKTGAVTVDCQVTASGALTGCTSIAADPTGYDFDSSASAIAESYIANPWTEEGLPADGAHVRIRIRLNEDMSQPEPAPPNPATKP